MHPEGLFGIFHPLRPDNPAMKRVGQDHARHVGHQRNAGHAHHFNVEAKVATYAKAIPPAVWIAGANYFQLDEARSSLIEHDRLVAYMKAGDTLRARDAVSFHIEEAAAQIRRAGVARIESYPVDNCAGVQVGQN